MAFKLSPMVNIRKLGWLVAGVALVAAAGVLGVTGSRSFFQPDKRPEAVPLVATGMRHPVAINPGHPPPGVAVDLKTPHGTAVELSCATCHAVKTPAVSRVEAETLKDFHQGLVYNHGGMSCLNCHNADNYDSLRLANGLAVPFERAVELCAQCHGPQTRDYNNGSHGGMTGYWDLSSGPRQRNTCVDCHQPHNPAFPKVSPVFPPRDGLPPPGHSQPSNPHGHP